MPVTTVTSGSGISLLQSSARLNRSTTIWLLYHCRPQAAVLMKSTSLMKAGQKAAGTIDVAINAAPPPPPSPPPVNTAPTSDDHGDVHITTFDGLYYNFQAEGEFVVAKSTLPGDSYQIQIRLQPWNGSTSISVMTEIAAAVGSDRVTFGLNRASTVWVDGTASTLSAANPTIALNGGTLTEQSSSVYVLTWSTGETLTVSDYGSYLNLSTRLAPGSGPSSVEGLNGSDTGQANDFQLADGTVIAQPLTSAELYGEFADAWRVTQPTSLFDYGHGGSMLSLTPGVFVDFAGDTSLTAANFKVAA